MSSEPRAITDIEADDALAPLLGFDAIAVAVSGGPDSMALMHLAAEWRARHSLVGKPIVVATVDHGLRPGSAEEAQFVAQAAADLSLEHRAYYWADEKPSTGIPAAARAARYNLLEGLACSLSAAGPVAVVTAHSEDDQAETVLMRLKRGAGIDGLSAMAPSRAMSRGSRATLVRPFLAFPKSRLVASLTARGVSWIEDPSNERLDLERPRLRQLLSQMMDEGFSSHALAESARRLTAARAAISYAEDHFLPGLALNFNDEIFAALDRAQFASGPGLLRERALMQLISRFGGCTPQPDLSAIETLAGRIGGGGRLTSTLGGAVISAGERVIRVWREAGRLDQGPVALSPGTWVLWDDRFYVHTTWRDGPVSVRPLGRDGWQAVGPDLDLQRPIPAGAAAALPAFWVGGTLLSVPPLNRYLSGNSSLRRSPHSDAFEVKPRYGN